MLQVTPQPTASIIVVGITVRMIIINSTTIVEIIHLHVHVFTYIYTNYNTYTFVFTIIRMILKTIKHTSPSFATNAPAMLI